MGVWGGEFNGVVEGGQINRREIGSPSTARTNPIANSLNSKIYIWGKSNVAGYLSNPRTRWNNNDFNMRDPRKRHYSEWYDIFQWIRNGIDYRPTRQIAGYIFDWLDEVISISYTSNISCQVSLPLPPLF